MAAVQAAYDEALARLVHPYEMTSVASSFGQTRVVIAGPAGAPALVLLHGWNTNSSGWWPQINAWAGEYRVYAPDTIGQAGRSAPVRPSVHSESYGRWVADVLNGLGLDRPALIGSSGGAWLILKLAGLDAGRIGCAVLLSPAGIAPIRIRFLVRYLALAASSTAEDLPRRQAELVSPHPLRIDPDHLRWQEPLARNYRGLRPPGRLPDRTLRRLAAPTLVLAGAREVIFDPRRVTDRCRRLMPNVSAEILPDAGHDMTFDNPEGVNQRILNFLKEIGWAGRP